MASTSILKQNKVGTIPHGDTILCVNCNRVARNEDLVKAVKCKSHDIVTLIIMGVAGSNHPLYISAAI